MVLSLKRVNSLQVEINNLEFKKEIFKYQDGCAGTDIYEYGRELEAREAQIAELRGRRDQLVSSLPRTEQMAFSSQQTRSFISSLPSEILSSIFIKGPRHARQRAMFVLTVSHVSRYWHATAMQTPFLWSAIPILPWYTGTGYGQFLQILLQRSKSHPLDIAVTISEFDNPNSRVNQSWAIFQALRAANEPGSFPHNVPIHTRQPITAHRLQDQLSMFVPHVSRWRTFKYDCEALDDVFMVSALLANHSAPILESFSLKLSTRMDGRNGNAFKTRIFKGGAPRLSYIDICGIHPFTCLPPLSSVTTLRLGTRPDKMSRDELLDILRSCVTLISLDIGDILRRRDLKGSMMVGITTLRSLSFSAYASPRYFIAGMLATIHCPAVESMSISPLPAWESPKDSPSTHAAPLPPFLRLRSLRLIEIDCRKLARDFDFSSLPALHTIELRHCPDPMGLLCLLLRSVDKNDGIVWPELRVIYLSHVGVKEISGIRRIIMHRSSRGRPIDTIIFDPVSLKKHWVDVEWMKQYVNVRQGEHVGYSMELSDFVFE